MVIPYELYGDLAGMPDRLAGQPNSTVRSRKRPWDFAQRSPFFPVTDNARCQTTVCDYVNKPIPPGARRWQLPVAPKPQPRKRKETIHKVDRKCRQGRSHDEFFILRNENPAMDFLEMDSVEGRFGGNVLLTLQFNSCGLMLAFVRKRNTSQSLIDVIDRFERLWGKETFRRSFPSSSPTPEPSSPIRTAWRHPPHRRASDKNLLQPSPFLQPEAPCGEQPSESQDDLPEGQDIP